MDTRPLRMPTEIVSVSGVGRRIGGLCTFAFILALGAFPSLEGIGRTETAKPVPPAAAVPVHLSGRPLYFEKTVTEDDLEGRSAAELRLMRNTLFARKGHVFEDPQLREYFQRQPWYRPRPGSSAGPGKGGQDGMSPGRGPGRGEGSEWGEVDRKNLVAIRGYETVANDVERLHRLAPGFDAHAPPRAPASVDCGTDAHNRLRDRREAQRLVRAGAGLPWPQLENYGEAWSKQGLVRKGRVSAVMCAPDLDGDGAREAVVTLTRPFDRESWASPADEPESLDLIFLASRRGSDWRAVVSLGVDGSFPGVEGSVGTTVAFATLADGRPALAVTDFHGGGGDCPCDSQVVSLSTLEGGKLTTLGKFLVSQPCACQWDDR